MLPHADGGIAPARPAPFKSFRGRTYAAAVSPESARIFFMNLQVWDTPDRIGNDSFVGIFSYAGMPYDEAERNVRLFAAEALPALQKLGRETLLADDRA